MNKWLFFWKKVKNRGTDIKECEDGWEELVNLVLGRWLRAAQQQAASYEPRNNSPRLSMICLLLQPGLCSSSMSVADWSTCWTNFEIFKRKSKAISMEILSDGGLWRLVLVRFFNLIQLNFIPLDLPWGALSKVFWVRVDRLKRLTANGR